MQDLSSLTREWTRAPAVEVQSLNHWTAREVPVACLLVLSIMSFTERGFLILMKSSWSVIFLMVRVFSVVSKKTPPYPVSFRFSPVLPSKSFIPLHFTFRNMIRFWVNFFEGYKICVYISVLFCFVFLHILYPVVSAPFVEETISALLYCLPSFVKDQLTIFMDQLVFPVSFFNHSD